MTTAPMPPVEPQPQPSFNPDAVRDGDKIRLIIEGVVAQETLSFAADLSVDRVKAMCERFGAKIELLERPFAVGDRVTSTDASRIHDGDILCILNDQAWVKEFDGLATTVMLRDLRRA